MGSTSTDTAAVTPAPVDTAAMAVIEVPKNIDFVLNFYNWPVSFTIN